MDDSVRWALGEPAAARKQLRARPLPVLGAAGFVVSVAIVLAGARVEASRATTPPVDWLGLMYGYGVAGPNRSAAVALFAGVVALVGLWWAMAALVRRRRVPLKQVYWTALAWGTPLAVGPPLFGTTVYSYVAYGLLQRGGRDSYYASPAALGSDPIVAAVDPAARNVPSTAGPLGSVVQHIAVSASNGSALGAVIILRVVAVLAAVWVARLAAEIAPRRAAAAVTLTALSPLVLLYVVSAARLEGVLAALLLLSVASARRGRWLWAVLAAALAGCLLPQGLLAVPFVIAAHALRSRRARPLRRRLLVVARDVVLAGAVIIAFGFGVPDGFGWIRATAHQFGTRTPFGAASVIGAVLAPAVPGASYDDRFASGAVTALTAAVAVIGYLLVTARRRPLPDSLGYALLAAALLGLVLQPWYFLWGTTVLAPLATGARRRWILALTAAACVLNPPGFPDPVAARITAVTLAVAAAAAVLWRMSARKRDDARSAGRNGRDIARLRHLRWPGRRDLHQAQNGLQHADGLHHSQRRAQAAADAAAERDPGRRGRVLP